MSSSRLSTFARQSCYPALLLWTALVLAPMLPRGLMRDDFAFLGRIAARDSLIEILFLPQLEHMLPLRQLLYFGQYRLFGTTEWPYQLSTLALHLLVVALLCRLAYLLFESHSAACATGLFFGVSSAHWMTPMWLSTQGQLLSAVFLLLALRFLDRWAREQRYFCLFMYALAVLAMSLSFSYGAELLLFAPLFVLLRSGPRPSWFGAFATAVATIAALIVVLLLRSAHLESSSAIRLQELSFSLDSIREAVQVSVQAAVVHCAAAVTGLRSLDTFDSVRRLYWAGLSATTVLVLLAALDWAKISREGKLGLLSLLVIGVLLFFFVPSLLRPEYFVYSRSWYGYLPQLCASLAAGYGATRLQVPKLLVALLLGAVTLSNAYFVRNTHEEYATSEWTVRRRVAAFRAALPALASNGGKTVVIDNQQYFIRQGERYWGVWASELCALYFSAAGCRQFVFPKQVRTAEPGVEYYYFDFRNGRFQRLSSEQLN